MCVSSTHAVSTATIASTMRWTVSGFRPSLKLGTHSTSGRMFVLYSLSFVLCTLHYHRMPSDRFITQRKNAWQRLEDLLKLLDHASLRRLGREEVRELGRIYRRTASDLAIARAESRDPRLVNYLNSLVIRAHGRIYRADAQGGKKILQYFTRELPQTFRRTWRYTFVSFFVFFVFGVFSYVATRYDPEFSELIGVDAAFRELVIETKTHWWESINEANQQEANETMTNNI